MTQVGFLPRDVESTNQLLWDIYLNQGGEWGHNAEHTYKDKDGKTVTLRVRLIDYTELENLANLGLQQLTGQIENGLTNVRAKYNLAVKHE